MRKISILTIAATCLAALSLAGCSPEYNWRDYRSPSAPYSVMFPSKPATHTRSVNLDGLKVDMTMTAAEVGDNMFAVGSARLADPAQAQAALAAMKTAMVRNIDATITSEQGAAAAQAGRGRTVEQGAIDIVAEGRRNGKPLRLVGHFTARGPHVFQVIALGPPGNLPPEQAEQFMSSFELR